MQIKNATLIRTLVLVLALVNQSLTIFGMSFLLIGDEQLKQIISLCLTIGASLWTWWKNNSFTREALAADQYLDILKGKVKGKSVQTNLPLK